MFIISLLLEDKLSVSLKPESQFTIMNAGFHLNLISMHFRRADFFLQTRQRISFIFSSQLRQNSEKLLKTPNLNIPYVKIFSPSKTRRKEYFPFHLIFHSLNIEIENLLNEMKRDREFSWAFQSKNKTVPINISISIATRTSEKEFGNPSLILEG